MYFLFTYWLNLNLNLDANGYSGSGDWQDSANNNDGVIDGATYTNDGNSDYFDFDGSNDVITVAGADLNPANTKCFEVWRFFYLYLIMADRLK